MKLLVFGHTGQVASALASRLPPGTTARFLGREAADLANPAACAAIITASDADAVINAAAYTAVDLAETDEATATTVNGDAPAAMARAAQQANIPLIHISTDYVFDGAGAKPFTPNHPTAPLGAYGRSKLLGEQGVRAAGGAHLILRTSWVFSAHGANFVKTMRALSLTRDHLRVVNDQHGGPTSANAIADACLTIAAALLRDPGLSGTYHFAGAPDTTWADFARVIFKVTGAATTVEGIPSSDYPTPARRPLNSRLDCTATTATFGLDRPDWAADLAEVLTTLKEPHA